MHVTARHHSSAAVPMATPGPRRRTARSSPQAQGSVRDRSEGLDAATVEAARTGDRDAWSVIVSRYQVLVLSIFLGYSIARPRSVELTQDLWLKLYLRARDGLLKVLSLPGLAVREARFRALDEVRGSRRAGPTTSVDDLMLAAPTPSAEEQTSRQSELALVRRMLAALPPRQREVMALAGIEGLPHAEVAERLSISTVRAKQTLSDARVRLRRIRSMPDDVQRAYLLVVVDGLTPADVAQRLGRSRPEIDPLLQAARHHLRHGAVR